MQKQDFKTTPEQITATLNDCPAAPLKIGEDGPLFLTVGRELELRTGRVGITDRGLGALIAEAKKPISVARHEAILKACGLDAVPRVSSRYEFVRSLSTRSGSIEEMLSPAVRALL